MHLKAYLKFLLFSFLFVCSSLSAIQSYEVKFHGDCSAELFSLIRKNSQLVTLSTSPPATAAGLRHRAEADLESILKVLHSRAHYNAIVKFDYNFETAPAIVHVNIVVGPVYPLADFKVVIAEKCYFQTTTCEDLVERLEIIVGDPATPEIILKAEEKLLTVLERLGHPLATIVEKKVIADQTEQCIHVILTVDPGPMAFFGPVSFIGNDTVQEVFFYKKLDWDAGAVYDPCKVERTYNAIEASGLFSSIAITHSKELDPQGYLPMTIEVAEAKHRSIGAGIAYATQRGPGLTAEWEHRNMKGCGERMHLDADLWYDDQAAHLVYVKPDFFHRNQDFIWLTGFRHESTKGYTESSFSLMGSVERRVHDRTIFSYGLMYKWLKDTRSDVNGEYNLIKIPMQVRWNKANNILDPTEGYTFNLKIIPTVQFLNPQFAYCINTLTATFYCPLSIDHAYVLASKVTFGSIWGSSRRTIPSSERFYEGSESSLRGYRYQTVSPLRHCDKPIGGRSMMIFTLELRIRAFENFSWVAFYDSGNVYKEILPDLDHKLLQSIGFGIRYHTPVGPLRVDFAVPLNRRSHLDHRYQIYLSIGQAF